VSSYILPCKLTITTLYTIVARYNRNNQTFKAHRYSCKPVHCVGGVEQRMKPLPTFFVRVKLWLSLRHSNLDSLLEPDDIKIISLRAIWNFSKVTGLH
jgi:hypothetical protein